METYKTGMDVAQYKLLASNIANAKDPRFVFQCVKVAPAYIESTNGKTLVRIPLEQTTVPTGVYKIIAVEKNRTVALITLESTEGLTWPNTDLVIPAKTPDTALDLVIDKGAIHAPTIIKIYRFCGACFSENLIDNLGNLSGHGVWVMSKPKDAGAAARFDNGDIMAVIMPIDFK